MFYLVGQRQTVSNWRVLSVKNISGSCLQSTCQEDILRCVINAYIYVKTACDGSIIKNESCSNTPGHHKTLPPLTEYP